MLKLLIINIKGVKLSYDMSRNTRNWVKDQVLIKVSVAKIEK